MWTPNINGWPSNENQIEQNYPEFLNGVATMNDFEIQRNNLQAFQRQENLLHIQNNWQRYQEDEYNHPEITSHFQNFHIANEVRQETVEEKTCDPPIRNQSTVNHQSGYSSTEMLTDAIATLMLMPSKLERTSIQTAENFSKSILDITTLTNLVRKLLDKCLREMKFLPVAGRFCHYLARNIKQNFNGITFCTLLLQGLLDMPINHIQQMVFNDSKGFRMLVLFSTDLYIQFEEENVELTEMNSINSEEAQQSLADLVYQLYHSALTYGKQDYKNIELVIEMLKLSGKFLEDWDKTSTGHGANVIKMHGLVNDIEKFVEDRKECPSLQDSVAELVKIRSLNWQVEENQRPTYFDIPKQRPNAIKIVCPQEYPRMLRKQKNAGDQASYTKASELEETNFTEDELQFMTEQLDARDLDSLVDARDLDSLVDARDLESMLNEESEDSSVDGRMPAEVEAAFEDFLNEQQAVLPLFQM